MIKVRDWVNNNSAVATVLAVLALVVALAVLVWTSGGGKPRGAPSQQWFYDLGSGELYEAPMDSIPPIETESGPENGVKAIVYSCSSCDSDRQIAWIEKYKPDARKKLMEFRAKQKEAAGSGKPVPPMAMMDPMMMEMGRGKVISRHDKIKWVSMDSESGRKIQAGIRKPCPEGVKIKFCYPGR